MTIDRRRRALPVVTCPGCKSEMAVISVQPARRGERANEIVYRCPKCHTETARSVVTEAALDHGK